MYTRGELQKLSREELKQCNKLEEIFIIDSTGVVYYKTMSKKEDEEPQYRLVVPYELQEDILQAYHNELSAGAHQGIAKTYEKIRRYYY